MEKVVWPGGMIIFSIINNVGLVVLLSQQVHMNLPWETSIFPMISPGIWSQPRQWNGVSSIVR